MPTRSRFPIDASRFLVTAGYILTSVLAVLLLVIGLMLAVAWPHVMAEAIDKGVQLKVEDIQPWVSLVLVSAAAMLAMAARMFHRLRTILNSVADGDTFTADNSRRLRHIGWLMIGMQVLGAITGWLGMQLPEHQNIAVGFEFSFSGILAALLAFVLAEVFEKARQLREDLEGTV